MVESHSHSGWQYRDTRHGFGIWGIYELFVWAGFINVVLNDVLFLITNWDIIVVLDREFAGVLN